MAWRIGAISKAADHGNPDNAPTTGSLQWARRGRWPDLSVCQKMG